MPAIFVFLLKVNIALLLFCAGYYFVLRHLTFYTLNRIYLIAAIIFATMYPQINLSNFAQRHELVRPVQTVVYTLEAPVQTLVRPFTQPDYWYWIELVFWMGVCLLAGRMLMQLFSMYKMHRNSTPANIQNHNVRLIDIDSGPFSFWKSIYVNPEKHDASDMKAILLHEQVHVNELHTLDILLAEISTIFYWFNPGVWLMKKAVRENIEFITDRKILNNGIDSREYQYSLVNVILTPTTNNIVNHFNLSTIKKRIIMMNAKRSSTVHISRYVFMIPAVVALLLVFTVTKAELTIVTKNSVHMFKALKKDVLNLNLNVGKKTTEPETPKPDLHEVSTPVIRRDTLHLAALLTIADTDKKAKPELPLYIDGVKTSRAALAQVDPEKIAKMIVYRDPKAKTDDPEKNGYISIITKGNEESDVVKAFNDKMRKQYGVTVYNTMSNFVWREGKPLGVTNVKIDGRKLDEVVIAKPRTDVVKINGVIVSPATVVNLETVKPNDLTVVGGKITKVRINGDSVRVLPGATNLKYMIQNDSLYGIKKVLVDGHVTIVSQKNRDSLVRAMSGLILNDDGKATRTPLTVVGVNKIYAAPRYGLSLAPSPISFKDKLIIIDGSEATQKEMKKLSADKIQSIDKLDRAEAEKKYGDKGKNGAILITTKSK